MRKSFLAFSLLFIVSACWAQQLPNGNMPWIDDPKKFARGMNADWYVDQANGNDNNNGRSYGQPMQNISTVCPKLTANQTLAFRSGSLWRDQCITSGTAYTGLGFVAYDMGPMPIIDGANVISTGAWSKTGGLTNTYQATVTSTGGGVPPGEIQVWENYPLLLTRQTSTANVDANPGSYYVGNENTTTPTVYVYPVGGGNPASDGNTYEYSALNDGIITATGDNNVLAIGIQARRQISYPFEFQGSNNTVFGLLGEWANAHELYVGTNSTVLNSTAHNGQASGLFVAYAGSIYGGSVAFINDTAYDDLGLGITGSSAIYAHGNTTGVNYFSIFSVIGLQTSGVTGPASSEVAAVSMDGMNITNIPNATSTVGFGVSGATTLTNSAFSGGGASNQSIGGCNTQSGETSGQSLTASNNVSTMTSVPAFMLCAGTNFALNLSSITTGNGAVAQLTGSGSTVSLSHITSNCPSTNNDTITCLNLTGVTSAHFTASNDAYAGKNFQTTFSGTPCNSLATCYSLFSTQTLLSQEVGSTPTPAANLIGTTPASSLAATGWASGGVTRGANLLTENSQSSTFHAAYYVCNNSCGAYSYTIDTISVEAKWGGGAHNWIFVGSNDGSFAPLVYFDTENLVVGTTSGAVIGTPGILNCGSAGSNCSQIDSTYNRYYFSYAVGSNISANALIVGLASANGTFTFNGDGASSVAIRQVKISEDGSPL